MCTLGPVHVSKALILLFNGNEDQEFSSQPLGFKRAAVNQLGLEEKWVYTYINKIPVVFCILEERKTNSK